MPLLRSLMGRPSDPGDPGDPENTIQTDPAGPAGMPQGLANRMPPPFQQGWMPAPLAARQAGTWMPGQGQPPWAGQGGMPPPWAGGQPPWAGQPGAPGMPPQAMQGPSGVLSRPMPRRGGTLAQLGDGTVWNRLQPYLQRMR